MGGCAAKASFDSGEMSLNSPRPVLGKPKSALRVTQPHDPLSSSLIHPVAPQAEPPQEQQQINKPILRRKESNKLHPQQQTPQTIDLHSPLSYFASQERAKSARNLTAGMSAESDSATRPGTVRSMRRKTLRPASLGGSPGGGGGGVGQLLHSHASPSMVAVGSSSSGGEGGGGARPSSCNGAPSPFPRSGSGFGGGTVQGDSSKADFLAFMVRRPYCQFSTHFRYRAALSHRCVCVCVFVCVCFLVCFCIL